MGKALQNKIIIAGVCFFILSATYLLAIGSKYERPDFGNNYWTIYFDDPKSDNMNFVLENNSNNTKFKYEVMKDKNRIGEGNIEIKKGETKVIAMPAMAATSTETDESNKKTTIVVSAGDETKEIYKN